MINRKKLEFLNKWAWKGKILLITGARQVGKSTLMNQWLQNQDQPYLLLNADEPGVTEGFEKISVLKLKQIVGNYKILIIDEVQRIGNAGIVLKLLADHFKDVQVIASGSSSLEISETIFEPLTGRHYNFFLFPVALNEVYAGKTFFEIRQQLPFHLIYGLYPEICNRHEDAEMNLKNLTAQYLYKDVLVWKDIRKPALLGKLLKLLAWQIGSEVSIHELANTLRVKSATVENYIDLLEKSFVIYQLHAFANNPRKEVTKMKKIYFFDNGIRNAVIGDFSPIESRPDAGALWENFMITERKKVNDNRLKNESVSYFWRNLNQSEVDYVEVENKTVSAFEFKYNPVKRGHISRAFSNLYPEAELHVITPESCKEFCGIE